MIIGSTLTLKISTCFDLSSVRLKIQVKKNQWMYFVFRMGSEDFELTIV